MDPNHESSTQQFQVGDLVTKPAGYRFCGVVLAAYRIPPGYICEGQWRYVVINADGLQHIFNGSQLRLTSCSLN